MKISAWVDYGEEKHAIHVHQFIAKQALSSCFTYTLDVAAHCATQWLSAPVSIRLESTQPQQAVHYFHGIIYEFSSQHPNTGPYQLTLKPQLFQLNEQVHQRTFQQQSVPEIVQQILRAAKLNQADWQLSNTYPKIAYCAQYQETDLAFIERILAQANIHYYFQHDAKGSELIFTDRIGTHQDNLTLEYAIDAIIGYHTHVQRQAASFGASCWQRARPAHPQFVQATVDSPFNPTFGVYYHGKNHAANLTPLIQTYSPRTAELRLSTRLPNMQLGQVINFIDTNNGVHCENYLVHSIEHHLTNPTPHSGQAATYHYHNTLIAHAHSYPPLKTNPQVTTLHRAKVSAPPQTPIHTNAYGDVQLTWQWDKLAAQNATSNWVPTRQLSADSQFIPRTNDEVTVSFYEDDIDQPVVISLASAHAHGIKTHTLGSEIPHAGNQILLDETADNPRLYLYAEKDMQVHCEKNYQLDVGGDAKHYLHQGDYIQTEGKNAILNAEQIRLQCGDSYLLLAGDEITLAAEKIEFLEAE
jgi:type VI secretion system secreted protein VgrG